MRRQTWSAGVGAPEDRAVPTLRMGSPLSLDPYSSRYDQGQRYMNAYELFFDWYTQQFGGVLVEGVLHAIELVLIDTGSEVEKVTLATRYMLDVMGINFFFADYSSALTVPQASLVHEAGKVLLASGSSLEDVFLGRPGIFGLLSLGRRWLRGAVQVVGEAEEGSRKTLWYMAEDVTAMREMCKPAPEWAAQYNMVLLDDLRLAGAGGSYAEEAELIVSSIREAKPDVVMACTYQQLCHALLHEMERKKYFPKALIMGNCVIASNFLPTVGEAGRFVLGYTPWHSSIELRGPLTSNWTTTSFTAEYMRRFRTEPQYHETTAFTAAATLIRAIEDAGSLDPGRVIGPLQNIRSDSILGSVAFDDNGMRDADIMIIQHQQDGKPYVVFPHSHHRLVYPIPSLDMRDCLVLDTHLKRDQGMLDGHCQDCTLGRTSTVSQLSDGSLERHCENCTAGKLGLHTLDTMICADCPAGTFSASAGARVCLPCPAGKFGSTTGLTACSACPPGSIAPSPGSAMCLTCKPGTYQSLAGQPSCETCEAGKFGNSTSASACSDCLPTFTTQGTGFTTPRDCGCPQGTFDVHDWDAKVVRRCAACPKGLECPGFHADLLLQPGYYAEPETFHPITGVYRCITLAHCPGGAVGSCTGGRVGIGCSSCPQGEEEHRQGCRTCRAGVKVVLLWLLLSCTAVGTIPLTYYFANGRVSKRTTVVDGGVISGGICLTTFQLLGTIANFQVPWPRATIPILDLARATVKLPNLLSLHCVTEAMHKPVLRYAVVFTLPFLATLSLMLYAVGSRLLPVVSKGKWSAWANTKVFNTFWTIQQASFMFVTHTAAVPFRFYEHPNGKSSLVTYPTILCWEDGSDHRAVVYMGITLLLVFVFPYFAICVWGSYSVYVGTHKEDKASDKLPMYRFLLRRFRPTVWWWCNIFNMRELLIGLGTLIAPEHMHSQIVFMSLVLLFYLVVMTRHWPWRVRELSLMDAMSCALMISILVSLSGFVPSSDKSQATLTLVFSALVVLVAITVGLAGIYLATQFFCRGRRGEYGTVYPPADKMHSFSDAFHDLTFAVSGLSKDQARQLIMGLDTKERLTIDRVICILNCGGLGRARKNSRRLSAAYTTRAKSLRLHGRSQYKCGEGVFEENQNNSIFDVDGFAVDDFAWSEDDETWSTASARSQTPASSSSTELRVAAQGNTQASTLPSKPPPTLHPPPRTKYLAMRQQPKQSNEGLPDTATQRRSDQAKHHAKVVKGTRPRRS